MDAAVQRHLGVAAQRHLGRAVAVLRRGGVVAYPTEAVYGLGCDPRNRGAVLRLLALKGRPRAKGLILIAARFDQLAPYVCELDAARMAEVRAAWPGPITWLLPARRHAPAWLRGRHATLAVRVTAHPLAAALCRRFGSPLVSTSANPAGARPARDARRVRRLFGSRIDCVMPGRVGGARRPSEIRDARTGAVLRAG